MRNLFNLLVLLVVAALVPTVASATNPCSVGTDVSYNYSGSNFVAAGLIDAYYSIAYKTTCASYGRVVLSHSGINQLTYSVASSGFKVGSSWPSNVVQGDAFSVYIDGVWAAGGYSTGSSALGNIIFDSTRSHSIVVTLGYATSWSGGHLDPVWLVTGSVFNASTVQYSANTYIPQTAFANSTAKPSMTLQTIYGAGNYSLYVLQGATGLWSQVAHFSYSATANDVFTIDYSSGGYSDTLGLATGTSTYINPCNIVWKIVKDGSSSAASSVVAPNSIYETNPLESVNPGNTGAQSGLSAIDPVETSNSSYTKATLQPDGSYRWQSSNSSSDVTRDTTGTASDSLSAQNTQTGILSNQLSAQTYANSQLSSIADSVAKVASSSGGGLTDAQSESLTQISDDVHQLRLQSDSDAEYRDPSKNKVSDLANTARTALQGSAVAAGQEIAGAFSDQHISGSQANPGLSAPSSSSSPDWVFQMGNWVTFDATDMMNKIITWASVVRAIASWILLAMFFYWYTDSIRRQLEVVVLVPTPVANTNPWGITGYVANVTKIAIWLGFVLTLPAICYACIDSASAVGGISWSSWLSGPASIASGGGSMGSSAWWWLETFFPIEVIINLVVLRVTSTLYMGVVVNMSIWVMKQTTSY